MGFDLQQVMIRCILFICLSFLTLQCGAWTWQSAAPLRRSVSISTTHLRMGLFDFLHDRGNDFVKLEESDQQYGPGPLLILYNCPTGIVDDEILDMIHDGAPIAHQSSCRIHRIQSTFQNELDLTVQEATELIASGRLSNDPALSDPTPTQQSGIPVLLFSGFRKQEMMAVYYILGKEIYEETGGQASPACAMVVPNSMDKQLRQVFEEITSDHSDAMGLPT